MSDRFVDKVLSKRLNSFFYQDKRLLLQLLVVISLAAITKIYIIFGDFVLIKVFLEGASNALIIFAFLLFVLSGLANFIFYTWQNYLIDLNTAIGTYKLEVALLARLVELDTICFNKEDRKSWLNLFTNDVVKVAATFKDQLNIVYSFIFSIGALLFLGFINFFSLVILLISTLLSGFAFIYSTRRVNKLERPLSTQQERYLKGLQNSLENLPAALLSNQGPYLLKRFKMLTKQRFRRVLLLKTKVLGHMQVYSLTNYLTNLIATITMILLWSWNLLPFSLLITANRKLFQMKSNFVKLLDLNKSLNLIKVFEARWLDIFKDKYNSKIVDLKDFKLLKLKQVCLNFEAERGIIEDLNLTLRKGERLLLVGPSGSGKSSLLNLIIKRVLATSGEVSINGFVYKRDTSLERMVSFAPPQQPLLQASLADLLTSGGNLSLDRDRIRCLVDSLNLDFLATSQIEGDELIDPLSLSEGQRKRLGLAQLLYRPNDLVILDEPLSSLDPENQERIFNTILAETGSLIFVSHHLDREKQANFTKIIDLGKG